MKTLINPSDISRLSRPISEKIDENRASAYIIEAEQVKVKRMVGDALLLALSGDNLSEADQLLLNGGIYEINGAQRVVRGLKVAIAYYAYAKIVVNNTVNVTRFGTRTLSNENSYSIDLKQLNAIAADAESYADDCLLEVVELLKSKPADYPLYVTSATLPKRTKVYPIGK